ncbi:MAG TPA: SDR family oxidoreductase [Planctomycetota bacterium]|jgi:UDP-glucose 4-epimerase
MQILVTGGAGFIGGHLVEELVRLGHAVRVIDNLSTGNLRNLETVREKIEFIEADLADPQTAMDVVHGVDAIAHEAAIPSVPRSVNNPLESHAACATATVNLLDAARRHHVRRVVFAASSSAYGDDPELPKHELMLPKPCSPYAAAKLASEHYLKVFSACYGLDALSLRYFNVFGPRQDPSSPYSGVIARFMTQMLQGQRPTILGDGFQTRDFVYVADVVQANVLALTASARFDGGCVNIGTGRRTSLNELVADLNGILNTELTPIYAAPRAGDVPHSVASIDLAQKLLGYQPRMSFAEGLKRTVQYAQGSSSTGHV